MSGGQLGRNDLAGMTEQEVAEAYKAGRLNVLLGGKAPLPTSGQLTREDIAGRTPEEITPARQRGQLDDLLGRSRQH